MEYTIKDLSKISGYAKSTVSAALNNQPGVGEEARKKIQDLAKQLKYTPNELAKSISSKNYKTIGVIIRDITNPFYAKVYRAIETYAEKYGYTAFIYNTEGKPQKIERAIQTMIGRRVAGIILDANIQDDFVKDFLNEESVPTVIFGQYCDITDSVEADDSIGIRESIDYLLAQGHKEIVYVGPGDYNLYSRRRRKMIMQYLEESGVDLKVVEYEDSQDNIAAGNRAVKDSYEKISEATAIIAYNDLTVVGIMRALEENNKRVPQDFSITSFDNIDSIVFPLTTVNIPEYEMGESAMKLLKERIEKHDSEQKHIKLTTKLIIRGSVKKLI